MTKPLICPACNQKLEKLTVGDLIIDVCKNGCGGVWFDKGEYKKLDEKNEFSNLEIFDYEPKEGIEINVGIRKCPHCDKSLFRHCTSIKQEVEIDECDYCGGIWVDAGELKQIRSMFETDTDRQKAGREHVHIYDRNKVYVHTSKEKKYIGEKTIICPACSMELQKIDLGDFKLDVCKNGCGGVWFDDGELEKVDEKTEFPALEILSYTRKKGIDVKEGIKICPHCNKPMKTHFTSAKELVEIDECESCRGIWLDTHELAEIREMYENTEERNKALQEKFDNFSEKEVNHIMEMRDKNDKILKTSTKLLKSIGLKSFMGYKL